MAEYLASIFGTEKDKVNCSFYYKTGACRHGERCSRVHTKPTFSQTIVLQNLYINPLNSAKSADRKLLPSVTEKEAREHFEDFYEDVFVEMEDKYGEVEELIVCDNLGDHLMGNVYVKFRREEDATRAVEELNNRWFGGRPISAELSPVTDFRDARCRQYETGKCTKSGFCNFLHLKRISRELRRQLYGRQSRQRSSSRSRSRSRESWRYRGRDRRRYSRSRQSRHRSRSQGRSYRSGGRERLYGSPSRQRRNRSRSRERRDRSGSGERRYRSRSHDRRNHSRCHSRSSEKTSSPGSRETERDRDRRNRDTLNEEPRAE